MQQIAAIIITVPVIVSRRGAVVCLKKEKMIIMFCCRLKRREIKMLHHVWSLSLLDVNIYFGQDNYNY